MDFKKNMKAGYQGRKDAMRDKAERLMNHPGHAEAVYMSKSAADRDKMRPYKAGGYVKKHHHEDEEGRLQREHHKKMEREEKMAKSKKGSHMKGECQKFALGGVAKIRHDEANADGTPKKFPKKSLRDVL